MFNVYFIKSLKNDKIYTGVTEKDPSLRLSEHNSGCNQWSNSNKPFKLIYFESYFCKKDAFNREKFYKSGFGRQIKCLIVNLFNKYK